VTGDCDSLCDARQGGQIGFDEAGFSIGMHAAIGGVEEAKDVGGEQLGVLVAEGIGGGSGKDFAIGADGGGNEVRESDGGGFVVTHVGALRHFVGGVEFLDAGAYFFEGFGEGKFGEVEIRDFDVGAVRPVGARDRLGFEGGKKIGVVHEPNYRGFPISAD